MKVGLLTIHYRLYGIESIKQKRSIVRRILADVRGSGTAYAAAEVDDHDSHLRMTLRIAHLSNDAQFTDSALTRLEQRISRGNGYEAVEARIEVL